MIKELGKYALMFVILVLVQVLMLNQVQFSGFFNPYIYILFILLLPLNSPKYLVLIAGFAIGFVIDIFSNTLGVHSAATVLIAFIRPGILRIISNRDDDRGDYPGLSRNNPGWFITYVMAMVFIHHFVLFYLEVYTFSNFFVTFYRIILSTLFSSLVIVLSQFLVFKE
jgi:hypothetical protein